MGPHGAAMLRTVETACHQNPQYLSQAPNNSVEFVPRVMQLQIIRN